MSNCSTCNVVIDTTNAYRREANRLQSYCKSCFNLKCVERWKKMKLDAIEAKGGKCLDCQGTFHYSIYDFHHLDKEAKEFGWSRLIMQSAKVRANELDKCVLLCSNCHRLRHYSI